MARKVNRGEIWTYHFGPPDKRRPVLVLSRSSLLRCLHTATVAAITSSQHGSPTEVIVGLEEGLKQPLCINLTNLFTVRQSDLERYVGTVDVEKMHNICRALAIAVHCEN